ncbi:MAG: tRNA epoxyqueuosine(34) reductase QueG [Dehalococcoidia bacterium]|nr:tRNA epoxyqueuosine(34) reductase QueG [Dehalococcoidia bacterium]
MDPAPDLRAAVLDMAAAEGFEHTRIAPAGPLLTARETALARLAAGDLAEMGWMTEEWLTRATDPGAFLAGARSVVMVALPCRTRDPDVPADGVARGRVARYARGRDYHRVFESRLRRVARRLCEELGGDARATVDYGPLLERPLAAAAGMGWLGKSSMLLVPGAGPWVLLGAVATNLDLAPDRPLRKSCGSCTRCIVACPTGAIAPDGQVVDARRCISYHTIENRGPVPRELRRHFGDWVFGCDACLDACPVGAGCATSWPDFEPPGVDDALPALADLLALDDAAFADRFRGRAVMRAKRDGLARNACIALGNTGTAADVPVLAAALRDRAPLVRGHAAWALGELVARGVAPAEQVSAHLAAALACETDDFVREELAAAMLSPQQS